MPVTTIEIEHIGYTLSINRPAFNIAVSRSANEIAVLRPELAISLNRPAHAIDVSRNDYAIGVSHPLYEIDIQRGTQGPQGIPGPPGGQVVLYEAGQDLSSGRAVVIDGGDAFYFQPGTALHAGRVVGVTKTAALSGNDVQVQLSGEFTDAGLGLTVDRPVFAGANGVLSVTPSPTGIVQMMGVSISADEMIIQIQLPLIHN